MDCLFMRQYTDDQVGLSLVRILTGMSYFHFFRTRAEELAQYFNLTFFLLTEQTGLTKQIIPEYKNLYGPSDEMGNLVMDELTFSDNYFMRWAEEKDNTELLDELVSSIYRPAKAWYDFERDPDGDPREEFNSNLCSWRAKNIISKWPMSVKLAISTFYSACRWSLVENNPEVFGGDGGEVAKYGLISVMRQVAKNNVLGDFNKVEKQLVSLVMIELNESIAEAKAQEKAMKR